MHYCSVLKFAWAPKYYVEGLTRVDPRVRAPHLQEWRLLENVKSFVINTQWISGGVVLGLPNFLLHGHVATFLAPVSTYMLGSCSKFACNPKISCFPFSILMTFVSDCSFYANRSARARFWLLCAHARSDHAQNLHAVLKLAAFHFLFRWLLSQIAPSMSFLVSQRKKKKKERRKMRVKLMATFKPSWLGLGLGLGWGLGWPIFLHFDRRLCLLLTICVLLGMNLGRNTVTGVFIG